MSWRYESRIPIEDEWQNEVGLEGRHVGVLSSLGLVTPPGERQFLIIQVDGVGGICSREGAKTKDYTVGMDRGGRVAQIW